MSGGWEDALREDLQPMLRDELMRSWHTGVGVGLEMAHKMAGAVLADVEQRISQAKEREGRQNCIAQAVVLNGLMSGFASAAEESKLAAQKEQQ